MRHPARLLAPACPASSRPGSRDRQLRAAELAHLGALDPAAELAREQLHPVADAEHREARARAARGRSGGAPSAYTDAGPPDRITPLRPAARAPPRRRRGAAAAPRTRRTRARAGRSAASTGRRSRGRRPLRSAGSPARVRRLAHARRARRSAAAGRGIAGAARSRSRAVSRRHRPLRPCRERPCRRPARAGGACPRSAAPARPPARRG